MATNSNSVLPKTHGPTEARFHHLLVTGLDRAACKVGKPTLAAAMDRTVRALDDVLERGSTPGAKAMLDSLLADPTALNEVFRAYGFKLVPDTADAANDLHTIAGLSHAAGDWLDRLRDGRRCHSDTVALAKQLRPLAVAIGGLIEEADHIRGAA